MADPTDEGVDDGPITLPPGACCKLCAYVLPVKVPIPSKIVGHQAFGEQLFCRRMPPAVLALPDGQGGISITAHSPPVTPDAVCFEFDHATLDLGSANG